jgi:aspartate aminotransferase
MPIAERMTAKVAEFAVIKDMFEEGARMKAEFGAENVFDFSLGNPDAPPPEVFRGSLRDLAGVEALGHGYTPVAGHRHVREALAGHLKAVHGESRITPEHIVMTVGASGALNDVFHALVNPGEEILVPAPYFVGYQNYAFLVNGRLKAVPTGERFHLDLAAMRQAMNAATRIVLINSPNNPSGAIYSAAEIGALAEAMENASRAHGRRIYLVSDEPYRAISYGAGIPSVFSAYPHTVVVNSFSKQLSLAGERIGYLAVHPLAEDAEAILAAASAVNSMLVVNAPSLVQQAAARVLDAAVDIGAYRRRRDMICAVLAEAGYEFTPPEGAFYVFPKSPVEDDVQFTRLLKEERVLVSPGRAFGTPGYFRISYAVPEAVIRGAAEGLRRAKRRAEGLARRS